MLLSSEKSEKEKIMNCIEPLRKQMKKPFYPIPLIPSLPVVETYCTYLFYHCIVHSMEENLEPNSL